MQKYTNYIYLIELPELELSPRRISVISGLIREIRV